MTSHLSRRILALTALFIGSCAHELSPPIRSGEPIGVQFMRTEPAFVGTPFRILIDFESDSDLAFLSLGAGAKLDSSVAHTGNASLQIPAGSVVTVKLAAMLSDGAFPAGWTLAGAYFICRQPTQVSVAYEVAGKSILRRTVMLEPRKWTAVMLDVSVLNDPNAATPRETGTLRFKAERAGVWCDDVVLLDNHQTFVGETEKAGDTWTVRRRGFNTLIERPGSFKLTIPSNEGSNDGWNVTEANELRVVLSSAGGKHTRTIYADGRGYLDGKWQPVASIDHAAEFAAQQASPAEISVPEEMGRVERNAPGDRNNDGYAEATGAYQIKAAGPRIRITLSPTTPKLVRPIVEIAGLPTGRVTGNMEGQLIDQALRLPNGHVLIEVPSILTKPTSIDLRVQ